MCFQVTHESSKYGHCRIEQVSPSLEQNPLQNPLYRSHVLDQPKNLPIYTIYRSRIIPFLESTSSWKAPTPPVPLPHVVHHATARELVSRPSSVGLPRPLWCQPAIPSVWPLLDLDAGQPPFRSQPVGVTLFRASEGGGASVLLRGGELRGFRTELRVSCRELTETSGGMVLIRILPEERRNRCVLFL